VKIWNKRAVSFLLAIFCLNFSAGLTPSNKIDPLSDRNVPARVDNKEISLQENSKYLFVGMEKCASVCHNNKEMGFQYNIVKSSPHADAFRILSSEKAKGFALNVNVNENPAESQVCLKCHITGAGLDSSFFAATYRREDGVTCEACHKGAYIKKTFLPKEADCLKCHNSSVHETPLFNFRENCAKIAHQRPKA
jgi:hypothetical protein